MSEELTAYRELMERVDLSTLMLEDLVSGKLIRPSTGEYETELRFVVARKWNSWYPSYFNAEGGCYAFISRDSNKDLKKMLV